MGVLRQRLGPRALRRAVPSVLLLVTAAVLAIALTGNGGTYTIKAEFDDVRGLIPGGSVRAGAVSVGAVDKVELVGERPVATLRIDDGFRLHEGATADIQLFSNAGAVNRTVELTTGDPTKPVLEDGATLSSKQTDQPVNFDDATETLNPETRKDLRGLLAGLDAALKGRGKDFDRTLRHSAAATNEVANLLAQVNTDGASLKTLVREGNRVTGALAAGPGDLQAAADSTSALLTVTARRQADLQQSVRRLGPALKRTRTTLTRLAGATPRLRGLVRNLRPVADELGPFARVLRPALSDAAPFLAETRRLVRQGPGDLRDFGPIIASARRVAPDLASLIERVLPLGNTLRAYIPETVGLFQNLGATMGTYDANGHMVNLAANITLSGQPASSTGAETQPKDCTPGRLVLPYTRLPGALECQPWADYESTAIGTGR